MKNIDLSPYSYFSIPEFVVKFFAQTPETTFPPGQQSAVTENVRVYAEQFCNLQYPSGFRTIYESIFARFRILPFDPKNSIHIREESNRRWKFTADTLLHTRNLWDGRYCNDILTLYIATLSALGYQTQLAKVFKKNEQGKILVHSLAIVDVDKSRNPYIVNAGTKKFWVSQILRNKELIFGSDLTHDWKLWKSGPDQWSIGLYDISQESTIIAAAESYYQSK